MLLTGSAIRHRGRRRAVASAVARPARAAYHNTVVVRLLGLSAGGLAVGVVIGLVVGR